MSDIESAMQDDSEFNYGTPEYISDAAMRVAEDQQEAEAPSLYEGWGAARDLESIKQNTINMAQNKAYNADPNYSLANDNWEELTQGIPEEDQHIFGDARSFSHARFIRDEYNREMDNQKTLNEMGGIGTAMQFGAAIFDEGNVAMALVPSLAETGAALKLNRLQRAIRIGKYSAAENAAIQAYLNQGSQTRGAGDVLFAAAAGFALGTPLGYLLSGRKSGAFTEGEEEAFSAAAGRVADDLEREAIDDIITEAGTDSAGAARTRNPTELRPEDELTTEEQNAPHAVFGNVRYDIVGRVMSSPNSLARHTASKMGEDAVGHAKGAVQKTTASEHATRLMNISLSNVYREAEPALRSWVKDSGLSWYSRYTKRGDFFKLVSKSIREGGVGDPHVDRVAKAMSKEFKNYLEMGAKAGVKGFDQIIDSGVYLPRLHNKASVLEANARYGEAQMVDLIKTAIKRAQPELTEELLKKISTGYWKRIHKMAQEVDPSFDHPVTRESKEFIEEVFRESGLDGDELKWAIDEFSKMQKGDGRTSRAKHRTGMDESTSLLMKSNTGDDVEVSITDLFENDAERLFSQYARTTAGHVAMAEKMGIKSKAEWQTHKSRVQAEGAKRGQSVKEIESDLNKLDTMYKYITGTPLEEHPHSALRRSGRMVRDLNFLTYMNQVGFAQLAEIGNLLTQGGFRATLKHVPELGSIYKLAKDGKLDNEFMRELEAIIPLGTDRLRNQVASRMDEFGAESFGGVDHALQQGKRIVADISLMAPINIALQRMAAKAVSQRIMDSVMGLSKMNPRRLASYGIDEAAFEKISIEMRKHVTTENSMFGKGKINKLNIEDWDADVAETFAGAVYRAGRKIIQENDIGNTHELMHSSMGKILTQFRSFMLVAWSKQTLYNIHMRDMTSFTSFAMTTMFGGLAYMAQTSINSVGRKDQKEYLKERLSPERLAAAAFQRSGHASLFPAAIDTSLGWTGFDPMFAYGRSTGLASGAIQGLPTYSTVNKIADLPGLLKNARGDYDFSQKQWKAISSLAPFSNAMGIRNILHIMGEDLPKVSDKSKQY